MFSHLILHFYHCISLYICITDNILILIQIKTTSDFIFSHQYLIDEVKHKNLKTITYGKY